MKRLIPPTLALAVLAAGCGGTTTGNPVIEDTSTSGAMAGAVGGALSSSSSNGTQAFLTRANASRGLLASAGRALDFVPDALASTACPTYKTASGSGCTASGNTLWLSYGDCSFKGSGASWTGTLALSMSSGTASCGTFPGPVDSGTLSRQYMTAVSSTTPGTAVEVTDFGTRTTIDDSVPSLGNFDGDSISAFIGTGYGAQVSFDSTGARTSLTLGHRIKVTGILDYSLTTPSAITIHESAGDTSRTVSGSAWIYHNGLQIIGVTQFNGVTYTDGCCFPVNGSVKTTYQAGTNVSPTSAGSKLLGLSETLTFTGCGTGTLNGVDGTTTAVTLTKCF